MLENGANREQVLIILLRHLSGLSFELKCISTLNIQKTKKEDKQEAIHHAH